MFAAPGVIPLCMQVYLIRHGQSVANAGGITFTPEGTELTNLGRHQANQIPDRVSPAPSFVVVSPFVRAVETARPTLARFPSVRMATWPVQEFRYIGAVRYEGTTRLDRRPFAHDYWARCDPHAIDGERTESYAMFADRARDLLRALERENEACIWVFTHGNFMRAVRWQVLEGEPAATHEDMVAWSQFARENPVPNGSILSLQRSGQGWDVGAFLHP